MERARIPHKSSSVMPASADESSSSSSTQTLDQILPSQSNKRRSPYVLVGAGVTAGALFAGLLAFRRGQQRTSQTMMRARVLAQGATVSIMIGTSGVALADLGRETKSKLFGGEK